MKSDKLQDAIGMVDHDLVIRAEKPQQKKPSKRPLKWTASIAAVLALAVAIGIFLGNGSPFVPHAYAVSVISEAEYPKMAQYPTGLGLMGVGNQYDNWRMDQRARSEFFGQSKHLTSFIASSTAEILSGSEDENRIYSPLNVYMALAMLAEITDGESRTQILNLLNTDSIEVLRTQAYAVWNANYNDDGAVTSILASSLWLNQDISYNKETIDTLAENYYASSFQGTMGSSEYNKALRTWLNEQTGGLLTDQIDEIEMTPETIMTLVTTIYFQAKWAAEFKESQNTHDIFHSTTGDQNAEFMNLTDYYGIYYWGEKFSATSKNLEGSGSMYFILPDEGISIDELLQNEEALTFIASGSSHKTLHSEWENQTTIRVNLSVPKFDVSSKLDLIEDLKALGVTDCFDAEVSDFTPLLTEKQAVFVSEIDHGARVAIDETGVTAAAYTEIALAGSAAPPEDEVDFVVDRPFIFVITGRDGSPLFIGIVNHI